MTIQEFNKLSMKARGKWIKQQLRGQPYGVANTLLFKDKVIVFQVALITRKCYYAEAIDLHDEHRPMAEKMLQQVHCYNMVHDELPAVKAKIHGALQRLSRRN